MRASCFWDSASSGEPSEAVRNDSCTPTRRRKPSRDHRQGARDHSDDGSQQSAHRPHAPPERGVARLDQLLPSRGVESDLQLPVRLHLASGCRLASPQTSPCQLDTDQTPLTTPGSGRQRVKRRSSTRQPWRSLATATGARTSPHHGSRQRPGPPHEPGDTDLWRAGCLETRTSGSEERARETSGSQDRHRTLARLLQRPTKPDVSPNPPIPRRDPVRQRAQRTRRHPS